MYKIFQVRYEYFYGGILTVDIIGCNLDCAFCFKQDIDLKSYRSDFHHLLEDIPNKFLNEIKNMVNWNFSADSIYETSPDDLAKDLINFSKGHGYKKIRFSSGEPTLNFEDFLTSTDFFVTVSTCLIPLRRI